MEAWGEEWRRRGRKKGRRFESASRLPLSVRASQRRLSGRGAVEDRAGVDSDVGGDNGANECIHPRPRRTEQQRTLRHVARAQQRVPQRVVSRRTLEHWTDRAREQPDVRRGRLRERVEGPGAHRLRRRGRARGQPDEEARLERQAGGLASMRLTSVVAR